jgi:hypothetical protein
LIGDDIPESVSTEYVFKKLQEKYHVFFLFPQKAMTLRKADIDAEIADRLRKAGAKTGELGGGGRRGRGEEEGEEGGRRREEEGGLVLKLVSWGEKEAGGEGW